MASLSPRWDLELSGLDGRLTQAQSYLRSKKKSAPVLTEALSKFTRVWLSPHSAGSQHSCLALVLAEPDRDTIRIWPNADENRRETASWRFF